MIDACVSFVATFLITAPQRALLDHFCTLRRRTGHHFHWLQEGGEPVADGWHCGPRLTGLIADCVLPDIVLWIDSGGMRCLPPRPSLSCVCATNVACDD